jgi:hypothetical protein
MQRTKDRPLSLLLLLLLLLLRLPPFNIQLTSPPCLPTGRAIDINTAEDMPSLKDPGLSPLYSATSQTNTSSSFRCPAAVLPAISRRFSPITPSIAAALLAIFHRLS